MMLHYSSRLSGSTAPGGQQGSDGYPSSGSNSTQMQGYHNGLPPASPPDYLIGAGEPLRTQVYSEPFYFYTHLNRVDGSVKILLFFKTSLGRN